MGVAEGRKTLSIDEVSRRLLNAEYIINLGGGSLLGLPPSSFTRDDMEKSLKRLLESK